MLTGGKALLVPASWENFTASAAAKLKLSNTPVRIFTAEGGELSELDELLPEDRLFVVENGEEFWTPGTQLQRQQHQGDQEMMEAIEPIDRSANTANLALLPMTTTTTTSAQSVVASPPPIATEPRPAVPLQVPSSGEIRRAITRQLEPHVLHFQSLFPGAPLTEVLAAMALAQGSMPAAVLLMQQAHPSAAPVSQEDLTLAAPARSRSTFDASVYDRAPAAPRVRVRADFSAVEHNVRDVVGPRFSQGEIRNAVRAANGDAAAAILQLLNQDIP